ncbi:hypothetical protein MN116_004446 [Schistosoma mekongi]|uniref:Daxx histone-binding domain-containing protein n=1 Tax=Schistosoma mekongi TaxID=38744 RepID=A0AAE2D6S3_SCHME|nr:hypothetical protein MN116_004446 [Schistosoma mekongi]
MRRIRKASKQFDTSFKRGSADTSGLGSSLDWVSIETGQVPFYRKMSSQHVHNPKEIITVHKSLDERQTTRPLIVKKHLTSDDVDTERYLLQEFPLKVYTSAIAPGNPRESLPSEEFVRSSQHWQKPVTLQQSFRQPDYSPEIAVSVTESFSPYRPRSDIPSRRVLRDPQIITRSFDQAYYAHSIPYHYSYFPTAKMSKSDETNIPLTYFGRHETIEWPGVPEALDPNYAKYVSGFDDVTREQMLSDMRDRSVHWGPIYKKGRHYYPRKYYWSNQQQQQQKQERQQQKFKSSYKRSLTLGDSVENINMDWMPVRTRTKFASQMYTTPPPTDEKEAYYNGLLMEHKLNEPHMDFKSFCRLRRLGYFNERYQLESDMSIKDESQRLLQKPQDSIHSKSTYSTRRRWTSAEIPEVKVSPDFIGSTKIQYDNDERDRRILRYFGQAYPTNVYNYSKYLAGRKRPYDEQPPLYKQGQQQRIPYDEEQIIKHPWSQTHKTDRYLTPHRSDSLRKALSLEKPSYTPIPLYKPSQQHHVSLHEHLSNQEESLESKFQRQQQFKQHIPYYSSSFDYPLLSSSKARPLIHPGYIQTYNFISPIEEKGDIESETKCHPLESKSIEDIDEIFKQNEKIHSMQIKEDHGLSKDKHLIPDTTDGSSINQKKISHSPLKPSILPSASIDDDNNNNNNNVIIPYDKKSFIVHKEVRINESQSHVPVIKKSVTLSGEQSPQFITRHNTTTSSSSSGILKVSVHLGESEIQEFAEYWDHSIFSGARVTAVCLAGVASVCLVCSVCASTWLYQGYANNITHSGFWKRCNYFNQTCEIMLPFITKHDGWQDGAFFILVLAILLGFLGLSLSVAGHLVYALPKRLYYFHSGGEAHVVAAFVTALSVLIYHITIKLHLRTEGPVNFGEAYGITWCACFLHILAAILLLLDEIINELVNLANRVHCFVKQIRKYLSNSDEQILNILKRKFFQTTCEFQKIEVSKPILDKCISEIVFNPDRIYVILNDLKTTFRLHTPKIDKKCQQVAVKRRLSFKTISQNVESSHIKPQDSSNSCVDDHILHKDSSPQSRSLGDDDVIIVDSPPPSSPKIIRPSLPNSVKSSFGSSENSSLGNDYAKKAKYTDDSDTDGSGVQNDKKCRIIARLEHLMTRLSQTIRELEEKELDLDELDSSNSPYLKLDVLKRQYLKAWRRHCELRNVARISGRILRQRFTYNGCQYPKVNEKIEEIINKKRLFPDWADIYRIIVSVNNEDNLDLTGSAIKSLAREIFIDVGHSLKQRRQDDLRHDFGCHLTDDIRDDDDPTYSSQDLRRKLTENKRLGETNLNKVFKHYIDLQHTIQSAQQIIQNSECVNNVGNNVNLQSGDVMTSSCVASVFNQACSSTNTEQFETNKLHNSPSTSDEIFTLSSDSDEEGNVTKPSVNTSDFVSSSSVTDYDEPSSTVGRSQEPPIKSNMQNKVIKNNVVSSNSSLYVPVTGSPTTTIDLLDDDTSSPTCSMLAPLEKRPRSDYSRVSPTLPPTSVTHNNIFTFSTPILQETRQSSRIVTVATRYGQHRHIGTFSHMASEHVVRRYPVTNTTSAMSMYIPHRESNQHFVNNSYNCSSSVVQHNSCPCTFDPLIPHQNTNNSSKFLNITTSYLSPNSHPSNHSDILMLSSTNLPKVCENETIEID